MYIQSAVAKQTISWVYLSSINNLISSFNKAIWYKVVRISDKKLWNLQCGTEAEYLYYVNRCIPCVLELVKKLARSEIRISELYENSLLFAFIVHPIFVMPGVYSIQW